MMDTLISMTLHRADIVTSDATAYRLNVPIGKTVHDLNATTAEPASLFVASLRNLADEIEAAWRASARAELRVQYGPPNAVVGKTPMADWYNIPKAEK